MILSIAFHAKSLTARGTAAAALAAFAICLPAVSGCGSDDSSGGDADGDVTIAATTGIVADFAKGVAGGDASVEQIIPNTASPHDFQLSAEDRQTLEESDLVVENGAHLEAGIPLDEVDAPRFALADNVGELRPFEGDGDEASGEDPHVWMDPTKVAAALPALAEALGEVDPVHADAYRERAHGYAAALGELDAEIKQKLATVPEQNRELVTSHDALGYFADRYGFKVIATPFPASGPEAEPGAGTIRDVEEAVRKSGVRTVFAQEDDDPEVLELVADETGVEITTDLLVEAPGSAGTYVDMMRRDADLIRAGLGG